jgi:hypothetical protein
MKKPLLADPMAHPMSEKSTLRSAMSSVLPAATPRRDCDRATAPVRMCGDRMCSIDLRAWLMKELEQPVRYSNVLCGGTDADRLACAYQ